MRDDDWWRTVRSVDPRRRGRAARARAAGALGACLLATAAAVATAQEGARRYVDATATHIPADPDLHALDATMIDADGDGDLDVALAVEHGVNRLYRNDGTGRLAMVEGAFGTVAHDSEHVAAADLDRDGVTDLVFVAEDDRVHQLFLGRGDGTFADASARLPARSEGNALAIGDVDGDGLPDVAVGNSAQGAGGGARNFLWLNDPARPGHFIDASATHLPPHEDGTQGIALVDVDGDGALDMVVANQTPPNRLLMNDGRGRFTDATVRLDQPVPLETREVHAFDADGDGDPDLVFFNVASNNRGREKDPQTRLLLNDGTGRFADETAARLPSHTFSSWGGTILDVDGDGADDIVVGAIAVPGFTPLQVRVWTNDGGGRFADATARLVPRETVGRSWGMAVGDLDGDGVDDLFIGQWGTQARVLVSDAVRAARSAGGR